MLNRIKRALRLEAAADHETPSFLTFDSEATIEATEGDDKLPTFSMLAYTGGIMTPRGFEFPVVVDLKGMKIPSQKLPVRLDHDSSKGVGHTISVTKETASLTANGIISRDTDWARDVAMSGKNGFPWQTSIGTAIGKVEYVKPGSTAKANGQVFNGPVDIIRGSILKEISFVDSGADDKTSAKVAASGREDKENQTMKTFEEYLEAMGFKKEDLDETQLASLQASYDEKNKPADSAKPVKTTDLPKEVEPVLQAAGTIDLGAKMAEQLAKLTLTNEIHAACTGKHSDIEAKAAIEDWTVDQVKAEIILADRKAELEAKFTGAPMLNLGTETPLPKVLEAAAMIAGGIKADDLVKSHGDKVLQAAHTKFPRGIGLQQILLEAAWANGSNIRFFRDDVRGVLEAAFSTTGLSGILGDTANKFLLQGFMAVEASWRAISSVRNVQDFKESTSYRLTGDFKYEEVGPSGELHHDTVDGDSFTNQAKTYGRMFAITRQQLINDDLGAFTSVPQRIGRGGALKLNEVFWTAFMDNAAFFVAGNSNYQDGAITALSISALTAADLLFMDQTDPDGNPLAIPAKILLVPNALKVTAQQLFNETRVNETTTANKPKPGNNPHAGSYTPVVSSYLSNSGITGYSASAWYLIADPLDLPVIETAFLNGVQEPTVEQATADFDVLGIQFRGYHDFGVSQQEYRAGVKSKGEA